ncbi:MAG: DUF4097 domain-containing protein [Oscillospiraceae bacterium]|jgi:DUF4097 and DUF4098 domain-containing protein YvlB|nr:DUF4097 domain-containing protein [Oscillospiraceae bacterium]
MKMGIKKLVKILSVTFAVSALICGVSIALELPRLHAVSERQDYKESWSLPIPNEATLFIAVSDVHVKLEPYDGDTLDVRFVGERINVKDDYPRIEAFSESGEISIQEVEHPFTAGIKLDFFDVTNPQLKGTLTVRFPRETSFSQAPLRTYTGSLDINALTAGQVWLFARSGDITARDLNAQNLMSETSGGAQSFERLTVSQVMGFKSDSGEVAVVDGDVGSLTINTYDGDVTLTGLIDDAALNVTTSSGRITIGLTKTVPAQIKTYSGDVALTLPRGLGFRYSFNTHSGRLRYDGEQTDRSINTRQFEGTVGEGGVLISVETSSGDFEVNRAD